MILLRLKYVPYLIDVLSPYFFPIASHKTVTALVRFPDFFRVNAPQMLNWNNLLSYGPATPTPSFFDEILEQYQTFRLPDLVGSDEASSDQRNKQQSNNINNIPSKMKPHWLSELVIDICLIGVVHAEQYIQHRSASLLHELLWGSSQYGTLKGRTAPVGSMYLTLIPKLLQHVSYLSNFTPKSQLRKDLLPCAIFVLEAAPGSLLRALWRKLSTEFCRKGGSTHSNSNYPGGENNSPANTIRNINNDNLGQLNAFLKTTLSDENEDNQCDILDVFSLLNLSLKTIEYEGSEESLDYDSASDARESTELWRREYLLALRTDQLPGADRHRGGGGGDHFRNSRMNRRTTSSGDKSGATTSSDQLDLYTSSISRRWQSHDGSLVLINTAHHIVLEMYSMLSATPEGRSFLNPAVRNNRRPSHLKDPIDSTNNDNSSNSSLIGITYNGIIMFVRAATSVYLQSLALRQSDIVIVRTFKLSAEAIKIFGIKIFLEAVGETLQHWMRVLFLNCGARRAHVRVEATDLLELVLRSTWVSRLQGLRNGKVISTIPTSDFPLHVLTYASPYCFPFNKLELLQECFGSFFRIRVPLLAVQTEVMERIVSTAAARYYRDQRRQGTPLVTFSYLNAEASLVPLWRTLDRIEKQPASQNIAFRGALIRMAEKLKKLYRAYVAARVLSFIQDNGGQSSETKEDGPGSGSGGEVGNHETEALVRARRISVLRVINASESYSKQFLGFQTTSRQQSNLAHYEAVEDALIDAADVFSPTELPEHRVAWLRMLADFHRSRKKYAEEATCHFYIHTTLQQASRLHGSLWSNTPFLPWTDNMPDPVYNDGQCPTIDPDDESEMDYDASDGSLGRAMENANSFRRIFYRVANSVGMSNEDWDAGASKTLFCGVTYPFEYYTVSPWITFREMEEHMVEEAEDAGELFFAAGIIQSSRFAWNLATQYYAEKYNFAKLAIVYSNLARTVVTQVPTVDTSLPQEVSATLGRFYRVWFHGGAPDELNGVEFVYRAEGSVRLPQFGEELRDAIKSIIPDRTPIHLLLDGRSEERLEEGPVNYGGFSRIGPAPLEPVRIKVTPLRPLARTSTSPRGRPEWFVRYVDEAYSSRHHRTGSELGKGGQRRNGSAQMDDASDPHQRALGCRDLRSAGFNGGSSGVYATSRRGALSHFSHSDRVMRSSSASTGEDTDLCGVDKFCFLQPKDKKRSSKEWWKSQKTDFAEKTLKVTQLQVTHAFPACVARQEVVHRLVYSQSPLEAGVDAVCQWCAVLFRTAVATAGQTALGENIEPGIGTDAAKVVADCIHSSNVKEMGLALLQKSSDFSEGDNSTEFSLDYDHLTEDEIKKLRIKIARLIVVFIELLHLLISRNRDLLLDVIQERKKEKGNNGDGGAPHYFPPPPPSAPAYIRSASLGDPAEQGQGYNSSAYAQSHGTSRRDRGGESPHHNIQHNTSQSLRDGMGRETSTSSETPPSQQQKRRITSRNAATASDGGFNTRQGQQQQQPTPPLTQPRGRGGGRSSDADSVASANRTDSAIAVQSELQRAYINLCKSLYPRIQGIMLDSTPKWLKQCSQDNYFSLGTYRLTSAKILIADELCFNAGTEVQQSEATGGGAGVGGSGNYMNMHFFGPTLSQVPSEIDSPRTAGSFHGRTSSAGQSIVSRNSADNLDRYGSRGSDRFGYM